MIGLSSFFFLVFSSQLQAGEINVKTGDVLLQPISCHLCKMIEEEEGSSYSHSGVVIIDSQGPQVVEAWGHVQKISLADFLKGKKLHGGTLVLRPIDPHGAELEINAGALAAFYQSTFDGHSYDHDFLWNNSDIKGEKIYCSELVVKLLNPFLPVSILPKPMHYRKSRDQWLRYFHGSPPDGKPGISPGDLERSPYFKKIGKLKTP